MRRALLVLLGFVRLSYFGFCICFICCCGLSLFACMFVFWFVVCALRRCAVVISSVWGFPFGCLVFGLLGSWFLYTLMCALW